MSISAAGPLGTTLDDVLSSQLPYPAVALVKSYAGGLPAPAEGLPSHSIVPSNGRHAVSSADRSHVIQIHGSDNTYLVSCENLSARQVLGVAGRTLLAAGERLEEAFIRNIPESTRNNYDPQYQFLYGVGGLISYCTVGFMYALVEGTASAAIGYGACYLTGSAAVGAVVGGAVFSTLQATAYVSGYLSLLKDAFYSNLDFNVRVVNFIYDNGLSLHWHSLMLNAQSIWGSVTAEKLNNISKDRWIHIHPRIVKRLPIEEYVKVDPRIMSKFRPELMADIKKHFDSLDKNCPA